MRTANGDDLYDGDDSGLPTFISDYPETSVARWHPHSIMPWGHPTMATLIPHAHLIVEDWAPELKNQMVEHIDEYHPRSIDANV